jgi:hypothetical protein
MSIHRARPTYGRAASAGLGNGQNFIQCVDVGQSLADQSDGVVDEAMRAGVFGAARDVFGGQAHGFPDRVACLFQDPLAVSLAAAFGGAPQSPHDPQQIADGFEGQRVADARHP